jgi:alpha-tubulin suppressor-like RCC1 family protein
MRLFLSRLLPTALVGLLVLSSSLDAGPGAGGGNFHTALMMPDGTIWTAGWNYNGEIGDGTGTPRLTRVQVFSGATSLAVGSSHNVVASGGSLYGWGHGSSGQLCDPAAASRSVPTISPALTNVASVAAGSGFTLARDSTGGVKVCGYNGLYGLGDGSASVQRATPVAVSGLTDAIAIAAGADHALAIRANGTVVAWGNNQYGKLGDGTTTTRLTPVPVAGLTNIVAIAAGSSHSLALDNVGHVWAWGSGAWGAIGRGTTADAPTPVQVPSLSNVTAIASGSFHAVALVGTEVWGWGSNNVGQLGIGTSPGQSNVPVQVPGLNQISGIGAARQSTFAFAADDGVWGWGDGIGLGDGTEERRFTPIVLADGGGVWRIATPQFSLAGGNRSTPITVQITSATAGATVRYTTNGAVPTDADAAVPAGGLTIDAPMTVTARSFKAGMTPSYPAARTYTFTVQGPTINPGSGVYTSAQSVTITNQTSGATVRYTLDGTEPTLSSAEPNGPIAVSTQMMLKAKAFRGTWTPTGTSASYYFNYGTLPTPTATPGGGSYTTDQTVTLALPGGPGSAAIRYTLDGTTPGTGSPLYTGPITISSTSTLKAKAFHPDYTLGGMFSATYTLTAATPTFTAASGTYPAGQVVAISTSTQNATIRYTLTGVAPTATDPVLLPGMTLTLGDYTLKATAFKTGYTTSATATATYQVTGEVMQPRIATGDTYTLVVKRDGTVWGFGSNGWGYLGDGTTTPRSLPVRAAGVTGIKGVAAGVQHALAVALDGRVYSWGNNGSGQQGDGATIGYRTVPWPVPAVTNAVAVAAGSYHSLALTNTGQVYAWGYNSNGQLGLGNTTLQPTPTLIPGLADIVGIAAGDTHSLAWTATGVLYAWGANGNGRLGDNSQTQRNSPVVITGITGVAEAAAGQYHSIARTSSGQVWTWGRNFEGALGLGNTTDRWVPTQVTSLSGVQAIGIGQYHSLASTATTTYVWGKNNSSQVGDGLTANRTSPYATSFGPSVQLAGGSVHSAALDPTGGVWTWGGNASGQLGNGSTTTQTTPAPISGGGQTWGVAAPTSNRPTGIYTEVQTVTLLTVTPGATIRYTTNGSDPTTDSPVVPASIPINVTTTLKARAFKAGLDPSPIASFTYTLKVPTAVPSTISGSPTTLTQVSLTIPDGALVTYTLNGPEPTESSTPYDGGTIDITTTTTLQTRAFRSGWTPSDIFLAQYDFQIDTTPPTCVTRVHPAPLPTGWSLGPTTVTFVCRDEGSGIASVTSPVLVDQATPASGVTIPGTATDHAGNSTPLSVTVKVDLSPPVVTLNSPVDGTTTTASSTTMTGTVADDGAGIDTVRCNGSIVSPVSGQVSCVVQLQLGRNPLVLSVTDLAGHTSSAGVTLTRIGTPTMLTVAPAAATMLIGEFRGLSARDESGTIPAGIEWAVSDTAVVSLTTDEDGAILEAVGSGTVTVTATLGTLTASTTIAVLSDGTVVLPTGTMQWSTPVSSGGGLENVTLLDPQVPGDPYYAAVESHADFDAVRAVSEYGETLSVTRLAERLVGQPIGDTHGGLILVRRGSLQRISLAPGSLPWTYTSLGELSHVAQNDDGTVFAVEKTEGSGGYLGEAWVIALDGQTGALRARYAAPREYWMGVNRDQLGNVVILDAPGVDSDGGVVSALGRYGIVLGESDALTDYAGTDRRITEAGTWKELFLTMDSAGAVELTTLSEGAFTTDWGDGYSPPVSTGTRSPAFEFKSVGLPDDRGNFLFWDDGQARSVGGPDALDYADSSGSGIVALTDDNSFIHADGSITDAATGQVVSPPNQLGTAVAVSDANEIIYWDGQVLRLVGPEGTVTFPLPSNGLPMPSGPDGWLLKTTSVLKSVAGPPANNLRWHYLYGFGSPFNRRSPKRKDPCGSRPPLSREHNGYVSGIEVRYRFFPSWNAVGDPVEQARRDAARTAVEDALQRWSLANVAAGVGTTFVPVTGSEGAGLDIHFSALSVTFDQQGIPRDALGGGFDPVAATRDGDGHFTKAVIHVQSSTEVATLPSTFLKIGVHEVGHSMGLGEGRGRLASSVMNQLSSGSDPQHPLRDDPKNNIASYPQQCDIAATLKASVAKWPRR